MTSQVWDRWLPAILAAAIFLMCLPRILDYGLTWDEPTYLRFAHLQADWITELGSSIFGSPEISELLSPERIRRAWLQHPVHNGHPPLNETWMGVTGRAFGIFGAADLPAMRASITLLFALTAALFYRLLRTSMGMLAAFCGALILAGVPAIWAHAHLGATEIMQCFFWIALAWMLPRVMQGGRGSVAVWGLLCALAFACKFTNVLAIAWVLGTAGLLGGWRRPRFWVVALIGVGSALFGLLILDPYFWPWQGGGARYLDYLRQCVSRADWIPISVFYWGKNWGFDPPWHYRIVETITTIPLPTLALFAIGFGIGLGSFWRQLRQQTLNDWPRALGLTMLAITFVIGLMPGAPNHDITRQFVFVYLAIAMLGAGAVEPILSWVRRRVRLNGMIPTAVTAALLIGAAGSFVVALRAEPFGLGYRNALLGGTSGAWEKGFETSYWGEAITPELLSAVDTLRRPDGSPPLILSIPKLNYFSDAEQLWKPLVEEGIARHDRLGLDAMPAFHEPWVTPRMREQDSERLRMSFRAPIQGILFSWRRGSAASSYEGLLDELERDGDLRLIAETRLGGASVGRLYSVDRISSTTLEGDPERDRVWYQLGNASESSAQKTPGQMDP